MMDEQIITANDNILGVDLYATLGIYEYILTRLTGSPYVTTIDRITDVINRIPGVTAEELQQLIKCSKKSANAKIYSCVSSNIATLENKHFRLTEQGEKQINAAYGKIEKVAKKNFSAEELKLIYNSFAVLGKVMLGLDTRSSLPEAILVGANCFYQFTYMVAGNRTLLSRLLVIYYSHVFGAVRYTVLQEYMKQKKPKTFYIFISNMRKDGLIEDLTTGMRTVKATEAGEEFFAKHTIEAKMRFDTYIRALPSIEYGEEIKKALETLVSVGAKKMKREK